VSVLLAVSKAAFTFAQFSFVCLSIGLIYSRKPSLYETPIDQLAVMRCPCREAVAMMPGAQGVVD
jgi:hypothetical protein